MNGKHKFFKSYFSKIAVGYILLTLILGTMLFVILSQNLVTTKYEQALIVSDQINMAIMAFLDQKADSAYSIQQNLYLDEEKWDVLTKQLMRKRISTASSEPGGREIELTISDTIFRVDEQFKGMFLGSGKDGDFFWCGNHIDSVEETFFRNYNQGWEPEKLQGMQMVSARTESSPGNSFSIFFLNPILNPKDNNEKIGVMALYFNAATLQRAYKGFEVYRKGDIYVLDKNMNLIFDGNGRYELPETFPKGILTGHSKKFEKNNMIYNVAYSAGNGYYIVNAFSMDSVMDDVHVLERSMIGTLILLLLFAVILNILMAKIFARRIFPIVDTMNQIKQGNLTSFPIYKKYDDETGYIYTELLRVCAALDEHIQKEYVYQLRQKEMELYALQVQIAPHFLYNSLEAIRMNLVIKGEQEASKMIRILSELFRNMMKKEAVVTIRDEFTFLSSYLELFRFRLGNKMEYEIWAEPEVYRYATIKHILQPIIENALVHGVKEGQEIFKISVRGEMEHNEIRFVIEDNGCGIEETKLEAIKAALRSNEVFRDSIGINNVNHRLRIVYGGNERITIDSKRNEGTKVIIRIKAVRREELDAYVQSFNRR